MTVLNVMAWAHPLVREWFVETFKSPSPPQVQGWAAIVNQQSTLISAPNLPCYGYSCSIRFFS